MGKKDALATEAPRQASEGRVSGITIDAGSPIWLEQGAHRDEFTLTR